MRLANAIGIVFVSVGCALPIAVYGGSSLYLADLSSRGGPPDQGAMVVAFFGTLASLGIGALLLLIGAGILVKSFRRRRRPEVGSTAQSNHAGGMTIKRH